MSPDGNGGDCGRKGELKDRVDDGRSGGVEGGDG